MRSIFDPWALQYDLSRRILIPCFDRFYQMAVESLFFPSEAAIRVLDLGAGTGLLSAFILRRFPAARLCLQDTSEKMLDVARERFKNLGDQVTYLHQDYSFDLPPGFFHAVVSALSIHHLEEHEKRRLFQRLPEILLPGGVFVNADQVMGESLEEECYFRESWLTDVREAGISSDDLAAAQERMKADRMSTLSVQLAYLREAGFQNVRCVFQDKSFVVFRGNR